MSSHTPLRRPAPGHPHALSQVVQYVLWRLGSICYRAASVIEDRWPVEWGR